MPAAEKAALDAAWDAVCKATKAFDWATATTRLVALEAATNTILDTLQAGAAFYAAFARVQTAHAAAKKASPEDRKAVPEDVLTGFDAADQAMAAAVEAKDWAAAQKQLAALAPLCAAFKKAIAAKADYDAAYGAVSQDLVEAWNASRALGIPTGERKALFAAWDDVCVSTDARKWAEAEPKLIALDIASQTVLSSKLAGQAFQRAFAKIKTEFGAAVEAAKQAGNWLDLPKTRFANARKATDDAVDATWINFFDDLAQFLKRPIWIVCHASIVSQMRADVSCTALERKECRSQKWARFSNRCSPSRSHASCTSADVWSV